MVLLEVAIIFAAGLLQDALNTAYVRAVADRARLRAAVLSGVVTVTGILVFARLLSQFEQLELAGPGLVAYALGNSAGTWVGLRKA